MPRKTRSGKDWRDREKKVMKDLGVKPQPLSGAGWLFKEDGESENFLLQLKSTDGVTYRLSIDDIQALVKNAIVAHKTPAFIIDFVKYNMKLVCFLEEDVPKVFTQAQVNDNKQTQSIENIDLIDLV